MNLMRTNPGRAPYVKAGPCREHPVRMESRVRGIRKNCFRILWLLAAALFLRGGCVYVFCGTLEAGIVSEEDLTQDARGTLEAGIVQEEDPAQDAGRDVVLPPSMKCTGSMPLSYAEEFRVDYYGEEYTLITIHGEFCYLLMEEGAEEPEGLPENLTILRKPLSHIYAASSSCPDFFRELGTLSRVTMSSTKAQDWTIPSIREAALNEDMIFVGKYSAPDYEYICDEGCDLAIENTMIYHAPEVSEMLTRLQIPVLTEYSSYEKEPLGRLEWIRLYALLTDTGKEADSFFKEQVSLLEQVLKEDESSPGADVVFFYIGTNGMVNVRREDDYVSRMISMAGGRYLLHDLVKDLPASETHSGSVTLQMESFYTAAKDADVLIYNGTLGESLESLEDLTRKCPLLEDFKAVKNKRVYVSCENLFQEVTGTCRMIRDFCRVIRRSAENKEDLTYLRRLS